MSIPLVDLSGPPTSVARQIDDACRDIGFFVVVGHGVPSSLVERTWSLTREFFDLPATEKLAARHVEPDHPYGYFPPGGEALARSRGESTPPDLKESFNLAPPPDHPDGTGRFGAVDRIWPVRPVGFREAWTRYYDELSGLAARLLGLCALALDVDPGVFGRAMSRHLSALRGLNYPPVLAAPEPGQLRAGAHSDYGTLTVLLPGPGDGGLEVRASSGTWVPVPPVEGGFVVNVGDLLERWTNDRWRSTLHRVALPARPDERRQAIAFFQQPNWDAEVVTLPTCIDAAHPARYEPVLAGPWLRDKFDRAAAAR